MAPHGALDGKSRKSRRSKGLRKGGGRIRTGEWRICNPVSTHSIALYRSARAVFSAIKCHQICHLGDPAGDSLRRLYGFGGAFRISNSTRWLWPSLVSVLATIRVVEMEASIALIWPVGPMVQLRQ